jgi:hypothetical protein
VWGGVGLFGGRGGGGGGGRGEYRNCIVPGWEGDGIVCWLGSIVCIHGRDDMRKELKGGR